MVSIDEVNHLFRRLLIVPFVSLIMSAAAFAQTVVTADFSTRFGAPSHSGAGFLYGMTEDGTGPNDSLLYPLQVTMMRGSGGGLPGGGWVGDGYRAGAGYYRRLNSALNQARRVTRYPYHATYVLQLDALYGEDANVPNEIWPCDNGNPAIYLAFIDQVISDVNAWGLNVSFEVQNEPDNSGFWQRGLDSPQYFQMWDTAVREIRRLKPGASIVGPSYSNFHDVKIFNWLQHVQADGTLPNTLNWHFSGIPISDGTEVAGMLASLGITGVGLSMNEYLTPSQQNSAYTAWYLTQLGKSNIGQAAHAVWGNIYDGTLCQTLVNVNGTMQPTGQYWAMRRYADQSGVGVSTQGNGGLDLIAATDSSSSKATILLGDNNQFTGNMTVNITGLNTTPYLIRNNWVQVTVERIPDTGPNPLSSPIPTQVFSAFVNNGQTSITIPWAAPYDAYAITLNPADFSGGFHTLTPMNAQGSRLDASGWGTTNGTKVQIWQASGGTNQLWYFSSNGDGSYSLAPSYAPGMALDVSGMGTGNGTLVQLWQATGASNQKWFANGVGGNTYSLQPGHAPSMRLDVSGFGTANGTQIQIWQATGGSNQLWQIN